MGINKWSLDDRPREKLLHSGAQSLSSAEILAILIGSGTQDESAVDLTRRLLNDKGNSLKRLWRMSFEELCSYKGIGPAKALTIMAACEFGKRRWSENTDLLPQMSSSKDIFDYFLPIMQDNIIEECHVMLLNQNLRLISSKLISKGGLASSSVDVRVILREALLVNATAIVLCHNHPSGNCHPSHQDDKLTENIRNAAELLHIHLTDHIIISEGRYYSYLDEGRL